MIVRTAFPYRHDQVELEGLLVRDDNLSGPLPGILVIHEFTGLGDYMIPHAERLARHGFNVLLADMYGKGVRPANSAEASTVSHIYRDDRRLMRSRARAGLDALADDSGTDANNLHCMGFSFGGCTALELARSDAPLCSTTSFYGYLNTPFPCAPGDVRGKILVLHGKHDKVVPMEETVVFEKEMQDAGVDCQLVKYPDAGHGFANAQLKRDDASGSWYCERTATDAWQRVMEFLP
ncbi:dienelactone hydrolase family protein [uncultured Pseudodesulfovibrio sp.]|uniref:dienelactone hydrolase family protein n=1 Tax=uncultured Pseudodesulfovibrio sp. TaxID=2035858 RepID=UPI0029C94A3E|nr:dienelactone hydrolase family protein [uncultured Pseudodesulfovibrio sp.]